MEGTDGAQGNHGRGGADAILYAEREYVCGAWDVAGTRVYIDLQIVITPWQALLRL